MQDGVFASDVNVCGYEGVQALMSATAMGSVHESFDLGIEKAGAQEPLDRWSDSAHIGDTRGAGYIQHR